MFENLALIGSNFKKKWLSKTGTAVFSHTVGDGEVDAAGELRGSHCGL